MIFCQKMEFFWLKMSTISYFRQKLRVKNPKFRFSYFCFSFLKFNLQLIVLYLLKNAGTVLEIFAILKPISFLSSCSLSNLAPIFLLNEADVLIFTDNHLQKIKKRRFEIALSQYERAIDDFSKMLIFISMLLNYVFDGLYVLKKLPIL